jgi:superfamily II DNA or RNA helicase
MLKDLALKAVYRSETDDLLKDFYIPALSTAVLYERAVGYFSAAALSHAAQGISALVRNGGEMRVVFGGELDPDDFQELVSGYKDREIVERLGIDMTRELDTIDDNLLQYRVRSLSWLVASGKLNAKVALRERGMYHEKIGVIYDAAGDFVVFQGSANETASALLPTHNFECINVFPSWRTELRDHFEPHIEAFSRLWQNRADRIKVVDFPEAVKRRLVSIAKSSMKLPSPEVECEIREQAAPEVVDQKSSEPEVPKAFGGKEFELMPHQLEALNSWKANGYSGILALATGAGKTVTAMYGLTRVFEARRRLFGVVAVPYQNLADQWVDELAKFNIAAVRCYGNSQTWERRASDCVAFFVSGTIPFACFVVVNRSLQMDKFQSILQQIPGEDLMFIGDECHHHAGEAYSKALPQGAQFRLGLSATPDHYLNQDRNARLASYYSKVVFEYSLADAIRAGVLTPYEYDIRLVELTEREAEKYLDLSARIAKFYAQRENRGGASTDSFLERLLLERARLVGSAANKLTMLRELLATLSVQTHTLFYCGDGSVEGEDQEESSRQLEAVGEVVSKAHWRVSRFTADESRADRARILDNFRLGFIDAMIAIRCLDEGIDVPACRLAVFLASSRNPRQFVQRRGRILRRAPGKDKARIVDFVVCLPDQQGDDYERERTLLKAELGRVAEFASMSLNRSEAYEVLEPLLIKYDLLHCFV